MSGLPRWLCVGAVTAVGLFGTALARADDAANAAETPKPSEAKDVVRLKNGGLLRGTISELIPGQTVTIVTLTGKTHEFPMAEVAYAGPADADTSPAPPSAPAAAPAPSAAAVTQPEPTSNQEKLQPYVTIDAQRIKVHLDSEPSGLTFHRQSASAVAVSRSGTSEAQAYDRLCTAPCEITLPAGTEVFALSRKDESPRAADSVRIDTGTSRLKGSFESRSGVRAGGWVLLIASVAGGAALMFTSDTKVPCDAYDGCPPRSEMDMTKFLLGTGIMAVGGGLGLYLALKPDVAKIEVANGWKSQLPLPSARGFVLGGNL